MSSEKESESSSEVASHQLTVPLQEDKEATCLLGRKLALLSSLAIRAAPLIASSASDCLLQRERRKSAIAPRSSQAQRAQFLVLSLPRQLHQANMLQFVEN